MSMGKIWMLDGLVSTHPKNLINKNFTFILSFNFAFKKQRRAFSPNNPYPELQKSTVWPFPALRRQGRRHTKRQCPWRKESLQFKIETGKSYWRGRLSTVYLLVLTSIDHLLFLFKILFNFVTKRATLMRRSTVLSLPFQLAFPDIA